MKSILAMFAVTLIAALPTVASAQYYPDDRRDHRDRDYRGETLRCKSEDYRYKHCRVDLRGGDVRLVRQISRASCVRGRSWGVDRGGIWVNSGCDAEFQVGGRGGYGRERDRVTTVHCKSEDYRYRDCRMNVRARHVELRRQISRTDCREGANWGWRYDRLWVDRGCEAEFVVYY